MHLCLRLSEAVARQGVKPSNSDVDDLKSSHSTYSTTHTVYYTAASIAAEVTQVPDCRDSTCSVPSIVAKAMWARCGMPCVDSALGLCHRTPGVDVVCRGDLASSGQPTKLDVGRLSSMLRWMNPSQRTISSLCNCKFATIYKCNSRGPPMIAYGRLLFHTASQFHSTFPFFSVSKGSKECSYLLILPA